MRSLPQAEEGQDGEDYDHQADEVDDPVHFSCSPYETVRHRKVRKRTIGCLDRQIILTRTVDGTSGLLGSFIAVFNAFGDHLAKLVELVTG